MNVWMQPPFSGGIMAVLMKPVKGQRTINQPHQTSHDGRHDEAATTRLGGSKPGQQQRRL